MINPRKPIFDAVKAARGGQSFTSTEVTALDEALDALEVPRADTPSRPAISGDFDSAVIAHLRFEEGVRARAYRDHLGWWTIGIGRLVDPRKGGRITEAEWDRLLENDPSRTRGDWNNLVLTDAEMNWLKKNDIERFVAEISTWPAWHAVEGNVARQVALTSMAFQLGTGGLAKFKNSLRLVEQKKFSAAADNMLKSRWARQTANRARRVTDMIRTGELS